MRKEITILFIGFVLGLFLLGIVSAEKYICLRQGETIHFSECNPDINDYTCGATKCSLCVNEVSSSIYCQTGPDACNDMGECTYLYEDPLPPGQNPPVITLINPADEYSNVSANPLKIEFSFKVTNSSTLEKCELIVNGDPVAKKSKPINLATQKLYATVNPGYYIWKVKCVQKTLYGGNIIFSESRSFSVIDNSNGNNTDENNTDTNSTVDTSSIVLTSPANGYSVTGEQNITFSFNIINLSSGIGQCNLKLNDKTVAIDNIDESNSITQSVSIGSYTWKVECMKGSQKISSASRSLTVNNPNNNRGGGGGGGGGGSGPSLYTLAANQLNEGYSKDLTKGTGFRFTLLNNTHTLTVNEVTTTSAKITVASTPQTFSLNIGGEKKIDINNDNTYDLSVNLINITGGNKANIKIESISEIILGKTSTNKTNKTTKNTNESETQVNQTGASGITGNVIGFAKNNKLAVALGFVIIVAILGLISFSSGRKKK